MRTPGLILLPALLLGTIAASAQDLAEAYNLSNLTVQGTARSMGFGNALGSVGGDFSSLSVNPAGIGVYRSSELTFTPSLRINSSSSQYNGTTTTDNNTHFNINNFGVVLTSAPKGRRYEHRKWKSVSFAFGMNRTADFNRNYTFGGKNTTSSASQVFESDANQYPADAVSAGPSNQYGYIGVNSGLLMQSGGHYTSIVPFSGGINQLKSIQENGGINEFTLSLGGNYKEKLMLGATLGIPSVNYQRQSNYTESIAAGNPNPDGFQYFNYQQSLNIYGAGVNLKLGAIYKISDQVRIGAAFHSPTYYALTDVYTPSVSTGINGNTTILDAGTNYYNSTAAGTYENHFDYSLTTPWKGVLSATFVLKNIGFVTADYEYVDYTSMRYIYPDGIDVSGFTYRQEQDAMNQSIKSTYKGASNMRIGVEGVLAKYFMLRAGFGYYGDPYKSDSYNAQRIDISGGVGFHFQHFFADVALVHSTYQVQEQPYGVDYAVNGTQYVFSGPANTIIPSASTTFSVNNVALTVGMKF